MMGVVKGSLRIGIDWRDGREGRRSRTLEKEGKEKGRKREWEKEWREEREGRGSRRKGEGGKREQKSRSRKGRVLTEMGEGR